jgi:hypothetical protein
MDTATAAARVLTVGASIAMNAIGTATAAARARVSAVIIMS